MTICLFNAGIVNLDFFDGIWFKVEAISNQFRMRLPSRQFHCNYRKNNKNHAQNANDSKIGNLKNVDSKFTWRTG